MRSSTGSRATAYSSLVILEPFGKRDTVAVRACVLGVALSTSAFADEVIRGELPLEGDIHLVPFDVPEGIVEIEIRHPRLSEANVLDYGLFDPNGFRGWGGSNHEPIIVGAAASSRSYLPGPMPAGTWSVSIGKAVVGGPPTYELEILLRTEATLEPSPDRAPYAPVVLASEARWYAGDFHVHSRESGDAGATLDEIAELAERRGLDFVVITDHNTSAHVDLLSAAQERHPRVLFIPGIELTSYAGHANGIGVERPIDYRIGVGGVTMATMAGDVIGGGGIFSINHPTLELGDLCIGCAWGHDVAPEAIGGVEIGTGAASLLFSEDTLAFWDDLLRRGSRAAALGGSDDHRAGRDTGAFAAEIGTPATMVFAEELSARAIVDGVRAGKTVVKLGGPSDPMIDIDAKVLVTARVAGGAGGTFRWVANGRRLAEQAITADPSVFTAQGAIGDRYRAEVSIDGTLRSVSSHVFIEADADPEAGCGCSALGADSGAHMIALVAWLVFSSASRARSRAGRRCSRNPTC
jgi:hypothetical protein